MWEVDKPGQWPEVVRDAMEAGGRVCKFQDVPEKGDCLVQFGNLWFRGIKLPELRKSNTNNIINFIVSDAAVCWIPPNAIVVAIPEPVPAEDTVDTTFGELELGDEFRHDLTEPKFTKMMTDSGEEKYFVAFMENSWGFLGPAPTSKAPVKKIIRKGK